MPLDIIICEWFSFASECDIPNWLTALIELSIGGVVAVGFFKRQQNVINNQKKIAQSNIFLAFSGVLFRIFGEHQRLKNISKNDFLIKSWQEEVKDTPSSITSIINTQKFPRDIINQWTALVKSDYMILIKPEENEKFYDIAEKIIDCFQDVDQRWDKYDLEIITSEEKGFDIKKFKELLKHQSEKYLKLHEELKTLNEIKWIKKLDEK